MIDVTNKQVFQAAKYTGEDDDDRATLIAWGVDLSGALGTNLWWVRDSNMYQIVAAGLDESSFQAMYAEVTTP